MTTADKLRKEGRNEGRKEGRNEGRKEGIYEGRKEGMLKGELSTWQELLNSSSLTADIAGLAKRKIADLFYLKVKGEGNPLHLFTPSDRIKTISA